MCCSPPRRNVISEAAGVGVKVPEKGSTWKHLKRSSTYRPLDEFMDGRFEPILEKA
jgi:hypothetical protein